MVRWTRITGLVVALFCLLTPVANAADLGRAVLGSCDPEARKAVFQGQVLALRKARMQLKFTLQVSAGSKLKWRTVEAEGFGEWISAPAGLGKYTYDKTVEELLPGSNYRALVNFRWKQGAKVVRSEKAYAPPCRVPDARPDLLLRRVADDSAGYVAKVFNRGRTAAGAFDVAFIVSGIPLGTTRVAGLGPGQSIDVFMPGAACADGEPLEAVVDPGSEVDESDEENDSLAASC